MAAFQSIEEVSDRHLHVIWTNGDPEVANNMIFMYTKNAMLNHWWDRVTVVMWAEPDRLILEDETVHANFELAKKAGVEFSACIACAVNMGLKERLEAEGVEVIRWGQKLSELMQNGKHVLSI